MKTPVIGSLWKHVDKNGKEYLSGNIYFRELGEPASLMCFQVAEKKDKGPDFTIQECPATEKKEK